LVNFWTYSCSVGFPQIVQKMPRPGSPPPGKLRHSTQVGPPVCRRGGPTASVDANHWEQRSAARNKNNLLASGSVDHLRRLQGGTAQIDRRRFRPNIYIESEPEWAGFAEDSWLGGTLNIDEAVRVEEFQPTLWCVTSTLAQQDLPRDLSILRTTAQHHRGCLGVYATIAKSGLLHVGDATFCVKQQIATASSMSQSG
jgi:uncharacterized protein YcbX